MQLRHPCGRRFAVAPLVYSQTRQRQRQSCKMHDFGRHFRLESQGRNPALAFAAILMVFGAVASFSQRRVDNLITESTGNVSSLCMTAPGLWVFRGNMTCPLFPGAKRNLRSSQLGDILQVCYHCMQVYQTAVVPLQSRSCIKSHTS